MFRSIKGMGIAKFLSRVKWSLYTRIYFAGYTLGLIKSRFRKSGRIETFSKIYESHFWKGEQSRSGPGSDLKHTRYVREFLQELIQGADIKTILDIPCGDWNWMKEVDLESVHYMGADIVPEIIRENQIKYASKNVEFRVMDICNSELPKVDLLMCRDCLVHLSLHDISQALSMIRKSESRYLLLTSYPDCDFNFDITTGDWRPLNFQIYPFHFPEPLKVFNEKCMEAGGRYRDKSLLLYRIEDLPKNLEPYKVSKLRSLVHIFTAAKLR